MKKVLQILFIFLFSIKLFSQLDREHWFAPMYNGQMNPGQELVLHLSSNEKTPFNVYIYNNNTLIEQLTISKGAPGIVNIPWAYVITNIEDDLVTVGTRGLYIKADRPCFANLRFGVNNHSEIITSKGTAGIGKEFYSVMAPNSMVNIYYGASVSILATEDQTNVTISDFKKPIYFGVLGTPTAINFTLNKGESYIADIRSIDANNQDGFIGAKIVSDKPISVTNGNFNGQYASSTAVGSDILMDQSVPVDKLGDEFVIVKGYGKIGDKMEGAVIVATEDNTSVYLNDSATPANILAKKGDYVVINENNYINRGNEHYNLHIKTTKNVYVYQLLAGADSGANTQATGGMNYIPPLNCYLPRKIDEISSINKIQANDDDDRFRTKLNIITEKGAQIKVNGVAPLPQYGPYDISNFAAQQKWVSYSIPDVTGNVTVESDKAVTAGIASGNGAFGYGGYFAGFSSIPLILKTEGDCLPGVKLEVTEGFSMYQWEVKDNSGAFVNAPVLSGNDPTGQPYSNKKYYYYPQKAGIYRARIQQGSCDEIVTKEFKFFNCTTYTNLDYETCKTVVIKPAFSLSSQTYSPATLKIVTPPTKGTAVPQPDGTIIYTANIGESGSDTFQYSYCGTDAIPDCEVAQATVRINQVIGKDAVLRECTSTNVAEYDLRKADVTADTSVTKVFYRTQNAALNEITSERINNFANFSTVDTDVYVRIKNAKNCIAIQKIELRSKYFPMFPKVTVEECDDDLDGTYAVKNLDHYKSLFTTDASVTVKFYIKQIDAQSTNSTNDINDINVAQQQTLYVRLSNADGCSYVSELTIKIKVPKKSDDLVDKIICPDDKTDLDIGAGFDNTKVEWYSEDDPSKIIGTGQVINDLPVGKYFVILKGFYPNDCPIRQNVEIKAAEFPVIDAIEINGNTVRILASGGKQPYRFAIDNRAYQDSNVFTELSPGLHTVYVISADNCEPVEKEFSVIKIYNLITPNNDGVNDILDMSALKLKLNVKFEIYDRSGKKMFEGDVNNNYIWDGKQNGKSLQSSSYWYVMEWKDFENTPPVKYTGWILLKNRNSD
ncbi:T9SS type B sorting domain-containing protein [Epilithonimonas mollis]|uniref:Gliding motility-associated C-terminal domain-containing protein n=1 Tax=Epilithonimonas mollis TaxID=216903 RepID=A0A1M6P8R8_9FLAO|nr:T9SS type B sorting domain-containing protein [Epilithonimonas mollis]SHK04329.1 gliding motility-associated C-terminal domain-containing protein [Epilithonimonas mollis]